jgi:hypothetical protein
MIKKLLNEELHGLYASPYIVRMVKFKRMRLDGHKGKWGRKKCIQNLGEET